MDFWVFSLREQIEKALQALQDHFGPSIFINLKQFKAALADTPIETDAKKIRSLLNIAICNMKAYSRLESGFADNNMFIVGNLVTDMVSDYMIDINASRTVIECIAELLGYEAPVKDAPVPPQTQAQPTVNPLPNNGTKAAQKIDNSVTFGNYEWRVLKVQGSKMLLITKDIIDARPYEEHAYNVQLTDITWEICSLRKYLNGEFLENFPTAQQNKIIETNNHNPDNLWYDSPGGRNTDDKIFLLSLEEVDMYFGNSGDYHNKRRKEYNNGQFIKNSDGYYFSNSYDNDRVAKYGGKACWWWLRSPGVFNSHAAFVHDGGSVFALGNSANFIGGGVRPALWLEL